MSFICFTSSPIKADFIKAKHQQLAFILRPSKEECCTEEELNRQLHSSVRTNNLETSLRLLAQGANPNYFYKVCIFLFRILYFDRVTLFFYYFINISKRIII